LLPIEEVVFGFDLQGIGQHLGAVWGAGRRRNSSTQRDLPVIAVAVTWRRAAWMPSGFGEGLGDNYAATAKRRLPAAAPQGLYGNAVRKPAFPYQPR
jgi:hypothetical protein